MPTVPVSRTVLIVEDEERTASALASFFEDAGLACETVRDGEGAIQRLARGQTPDLIVLDLGTPDGPTWALALADHPLVLVCGAGPEACEPFARALGAVDWMGTPVNLQRLLAVWERLDRELGWRRTDAAPSLGG